ncbi:MAG: hypothetical protein VX438_17980 [Planctomycetota bacterium]|nr:hypothetical protein [Planctomycetota bacterium]
MHMSILVFLLTVSAAMTLPIGATDESLPTTVDGRKLALRKTADVFIKGKARIDTKAEISVSDNQTAVLVDQWNGGKFFIPLTPDGARIQPIPVRGWNRPILIPQSTKVVTKTWGYVMVNAPREAAINQLVAVPHEMEEGDWIDPVVSPRGDILATRPTINELQFWDLKTLKPLTDPIQQPGRVSGISFSSDGKYFRVYAGDRLRVLHPRTGKMVAGPFQMGPFRYYPYSPGIGYARSRPRAAYEPATERIVCFQNKGKDATLSCTAVVRWLKDKAEAVSFELPVHAYQGSWIDKNHLLVQAGRQLETNWYNTYPLLVVSLKSGVPKITEWHPDIDHYGIAPDGKHVVATIRRGPVGESVCWKVGQPKPLWTAAGCFAGFGKDGWVLTHDRGRTATIRSVETGAALWEQPEVMVTLVKGQHVWLFFEHSFQSWKAEWRIDRRPAEEPSGIR